MRSGRGVAVTAAYTSQDLALRVEASERTVLVSTNHGTSWCPLSPDEARRFAAGLCIAAKRVDEAGTERERAA
jgi:hypothetical protein